MNGLTGGEVISIVVSGVFGTFTLMLSAIIWLLRNTYEKEGAATAKHFERTEKEMETLKRQAETNGDELHKIQLLLVKFESDGRLTEERYDRLNARDDDQERMLQKLKERLDRGDRTMSGQAPAARISREDPASDPPIPPPRPRLPSRRE